MIAVAARIIAAASGQSRALRPHRNLFVSMASRAAGERLSLMVGIHGTRAL
jgi:hypothetical protein